MDSDSKIQKVEQDRLSNLPTCLISHILSLLPTKYAVITSSLSTFWKQQWTSITQLRLDDTFATEASSTPETKASFVKFVYRVLFHLKVARPDVFQLNCSQYYEVKHLYSWVYIALHRCIQHIDLSFSNVKWIPLPKRLFSSRNLVVLKLDTGGYLDVPMVVSLDSLKILHLAVMFLGNDSLSRLVSSCPLLEELKMRGSISKNVNEVKISSVGLKRLILIGFVSPSPRYPYSYEVVLKTPGLQYLELCDCHVPVSYSIEILHYLNRAHIDVVHHHYFLRKPIIRAACFARMRHTMTSLAVGISHVKFLYLSKKACQDAVRTSTLSTHWNQQWALKTNLIFDDGLLIEENSIFKRNPTPRSETSFVNFVYRVLLSKVTCLDLFSIKGFRDYGAVNVTQWLSIALSRDVREIDLEIPLVGHCLGHQLFSSRTLVSLTLGLGLLLKVPEIISLESLKTLHLNEVQFEDGESLSRLVSSCLVLEELKIEGKLCETVYVLNISSPVLKTLILIRLHSLWFSEIDGVHSYEVVLNTPSLRYLEHTDNGVPDGYHIESTLLCLDVARLNLYLSSYDVDEYDELILARSMADLVVAISNVQFLFLSEVTFEAFYRDSALANFQLPIFPRLNNLDIGAIDTYEGFCLLTAFLQSSPQLSSLYYKLENEPEFWDPPTDVPSCMLYNLKVIGVEYLCAPGRGRGPGLCMVKYFLEKANCLEELRISSEEEKNEEFIKEVSLLPRASSSCKIVLT